MKNSCSVRLYLCTCEDLALVVFGHGSMQLRFSVTNCMLFGTIGATTVDVMDSNTLKWLCTNQL